MQCGTDNKFFVGTHLSFLDRVYHNLKALSKCNMEKGCVSSKPMPECYFFHILRVWQCFSWLKAFLVDKFLVLATFSNSKLVTRVTNSTAFSIHSVVFSKECCMEKKTVIHLIFTHVNALNDNKQLDSLILSTFLIMGSAHFFLLIYNY